MGYNVLLKKRVRATHYEDWSEWDVFVERAITLPFPPRIDIQLQLERDDPDSVESVTWDLIGGFFEVWLAPDSITNSGFFNTGPDREALRDHIENLQQFGWKYSNPH